MADIDIEATVRNEVEVEHSPKHRHDEVDVPMTRIVDTEVAMSQTGATIHRGTVHAEFRCPQCGTHVVIDELVDVETFLTIDAEGSTDVSVSYREWRTT